ncbi:MAG: alpha-E domain-containing protein [Planctomycetaceae bacterium]|nr:alpha-E domain-containing protein [Planctomycetaceae bacterium]
MLSRVADSIYWMARYIERAENLARFIDVTQYFSLDQPDATNHWKPLIQVTGDEELFLKRHDAFTPEAVVHFLTFDREYSHSILASLTAARENARSVREAISSEVWEHLNDFYHGVKSAEQQFQDDVRAFARYGSADNLFDWVKRNSLIFEGLIDSTMSRGIGWHFANLGRLLERADKTSRILDVKYFTLLPSLDHVGTTFDDLQWSELLRSVSAFEMYRKQYQTITVPRVVQFLVLDEMFPRAVRYCLAEAFSSLKAISNNGLKRTDDGRLLNRAEQELALLCAELDSLGATTIIQRGMHQFVDHLQRRLNDVGDRVYSQFLLVGP